MPSATPVRRTQAERRATTRAALLVAAREVLTEKGFAATGREEVAERAGVTRGALYHHFESMHALFVAVVDEIEAELLDRLLAAALGGRDPVDRLQRAGRAYLEAAAEPDVARIYLGEARGVLGLEECRRRNAQIAELLARALEAAEAEGHTVLGDRFVAASLIVGLLDEAATLVATAGASKAKVRATVDAVLAALLPVT